MRSPWVEETPQTFEKPRSIHLESSPDPQTTAYGSSM